MDWPGALMPGNARTTRVALAGHNSDPTAVYTHGQTRTQLILCLQADKPGAILG